MTDYITIKVITAPANAWYAKHVGKFYRVEAEPHSVRRASSPDGYSISLYYCPDTDGYFRMGDVSEAFK